MARIVLATFGSLGDLHPVIALALGLQQRGHHAVIATNEFYRSKIAALGLPFHPLRPDLSLADEAMVARIMDGSGGTEYLMRELVFPHVGAMYADLAVAAAQADLLLSGELVCAAPLLAEKTGVRWAFHALSPISFFSAFDPPLLPGPPGTRFIQSLGPAANRVFFALAKRMTHAWSAPVRALRRELGLPPGDSPIFDGKYSPRLNLALFSAVLQAPPPDWPAGTIQTGFLFHDEGEATPNLPAAVENFLAAGEPPIVFTLGSAAVSLASDFYVQGARAAESLGRRALLLLGRNPPPPGLPSSILAWDYLPYAKIFPRASAIVHQGGVGTTAQALRSGRPMLVVPFAHDQFDNAARVVRLGSARTLARSRCRAARLAQELAALFDDPRYARAAAERGVRVRADDGVAATCDVIERQLL
jgi:UDP:flavonoid glycosyltransferase YjiC (YdhE family)